MHDFTLIAAAQALMCKVPDASYKSWQFLIQNELALSQWLTMRQT